MINGGLKIQIAPVHPEGLVYESDTGIITGVEVDGMIYFLKPLR